PPLQRTPPLPGCFLPRCRNYSRTAVAVLKEPVMFDYGGERIDVLATRRPQPASSTTTTTLPPQTPFRPWGTSPPPPTWQPSQARASPLPPRLRKGQGKAGGRGQKGKGAKKQRKKKGPRDKARTPLAHQQPPTGEGSPRKQPAVQGLGKGGAQAPPMGQGDSFNAILSDEPGRGGSQLDAAAAAAAGLPESMQTVPPKGHPTAGSSGLRKRKRGRRKRRRKLQKEEESSPRRQKLSVPGRDLEEGGGAA
ncbi:uncharacterized protein LOC113432159, partial [Notechis scutatus]|uniref:Uncharacterized protein LOC113432159 n=1 Tax=Notechis scutatus TaxID=8663 RepID=A0A6J1WCA7_9SAUR